MLFVHLSDLHVFARQSETEAVRKDIVRAVSRIVADIAALPLAPDAVLITGDLADGGSPDDYALLIDLFAPLPMPILAVPGNHDRRGPMRAALEPVMGFEPGPYLNLSTRIGDVGIIGLDTVIAGRVEGEVCDDRLDWLEARLAHAGDLTFVLAHHPPLPTGNAAWDATALVRGRERLAAIIANAPGQVRLLTGHVHQAMHGVWAGRYAAIGGSPAFTYGFGIAMDGEPETVRLPYCYFLHHRREDGSVGVHSRYVDLG